MDLISSKKSWMVGAMLVASLGVTGCATEKYVNEHVATVDSKVTATQGQVDAHGQQLAAHDAKLADLDKTSREALERAEAAGKLAEGKFLYSMVLQDDGVKFKSAKYKLTPEDEQRLNEFAEKLKTDNKNVYLEIQGHTDAAGSPDANRRLGEERAEAVRVYLNQHGVALNRMNTISYGEQAPVASNKTKAGRAQNRRVQIVVLA
jgi:outer membrane protein OmpA-like peptidoglycan-associated protein